MRLFPHSLKEEKLSSAFEIWTKINHFNIGKEKSKISKVWYRNTDNILYGWVNRHYSDIFVHKFHPHLPCETLDSIYYSIYDFINERGFLFSSKRRKSHYYCSTTESQSWQQTFPNFF